MSTIIEWLGNAALRVTHENMTFFVDPWLDDNPGCPIKTNQVKHADLVFVTHGHPGHWGKGDSVKIANATDALYIAPTPLCDYLVSKKMLPNNRVFPVQPGKTYEVKGIDFEVLSAPHPPIGPQLDWLAEVPGEPNCGFVWELEGKTILNFGDAEYGNFFEEIGKRYQIDLAILPLWGAGMLIPLEQGVRVCADIIAVLKPRRVLPTNRYQQDNPAVKLLVETLHSRGMNVEVIPQEIGIKIDV